MDRPDRRQILSAMGAVAAWPAVALGVPPLPPHPDRPDTPDSLIARMVFREAPARRVLYTWTTDKQIAALRKGGRLLRRATSPRHGKSRFDRTLALPPAKDHWAAPHLARKRFRRFAWPYPWATLLGWPGETYGQHLLRITLKPSLTLSARFQVWGQTVGSLDDTRWQEKRVSRAEWDVFDAAGQPVKSTAADAGRVGAVYHENVSFVGGAMSTFFIAGPTLREYVLFDEAHVAGFSYGDPACRAALESDLRLLDQLIANPWNARYGRIGQHIHQSWRRFDPKARAPSSAWGMAFAANLPWKNPNYALTAGSLKQARVAVASALAGQGKGFERAL